MHPKIKAGLEYLMQGAIYVAMAAGAGALLYQGCLKRTTLEDVTVEDEKTSYARDYETGLDFDFHQIKLDKYEDWVYTDGGISPGDKFGSVTLRHNWFLGDKLVNYEGRKDGTNAR